MNRKSRARGGGAYNGAWGVVVGAVFLLAAYFVPSYGLVTVKANQMKGGSNGRQIVSLLMTYASENNGLYPDQVKNLSRQTANAVFREAFLYFAQEGLEWDETMFGCPFSMVEPDGNIGSAPGFEQALMAGENHWMFTAGLSNTSSSHYPVIMEDAVHAGWPPQWLPYSKPASRFSDPRRPPGTAWPGGQILMCLNDASVQTVKLELRQGLWHLPASVLKPAGMEPWPELKILDVE